MDFVGNGGMGTTHAMVENRLIWIVTRMHIEMIRYPIWYYNLALFNLHTSLLMNFSWRIPIYIVNTWREFIGFLFCYDSLGAMWCKLILGLVTRERMVWGETSLFEIIALVLSSLELQGISSYLSFCAQLSSICKVNEKRHISFSLKKT
jgi:hypothetical protein